MEFTSIWIALYIIYIIWCIPLRPPSFRLQCWQQAKGSQHKYQILLLQSLLWLWSWKKFDSAVVNKRSTLPYYSNDSRICPSWQKDKTLKTCFTSEFFSHLAIASHMQCIFYFLPPNAKACQETWPYQNLIVNKQIFLEKIFQYIYKNIKKMGLSSFTLKTIKQSNQPRFFLHNTSSLYLDK